MLTHPGFVTEIRQAAGSPDEGGSQLIFIACPEAVIPIPGQFVQAVSKGPMSNMGFSEPAVAPVLFPTIVFEPELDPGSQPGFWAATRQEMSYSPGLELDLRGPLGQGFRLSAGTRRLGLAALGDQLARVLPLVAAVLETRGEVAIFCDLPLPDGLPPAVEAHPLVELPQAFGWADELAIDLPVEQVEYLGKLLELAPGQTLPCPGQVLVEIPMPCAGLAACGACAVTTRRGVSLVCEQGPVYDLARLIR